MRRLPRVGPRGRGSSSSAGRGDLRADDYEEFHGDTTPSPSPSPSPIVQQDNSPRTSVSRRGPNQSIGVPRHPSQRVHLEISSTGRFVGNTVTHELYLILKSSFRGPWTTWDDVPQAERDHMFEMFQARFQWPEEQDKEVYLAWTSAMHGRFRDWMKLAREWAAERALEQDGITWDKKDMSVIRGHHPPYITEPFWHQMIDQVWSTPRWLARSRSGRTNRATEDEGVSSRHTGGTINTEEHQRRMTRDWGREPTSLELFERTYCSNRKYAPGATGPPEDPPVYIYPKAGKVATRFREVRDEAQASQTSDDPPIDEVALWEQSAGGRRKGRLFGFGSSQDPRYVVIGECSGGSASSSEVADLREQMQRMEARHQEEQARHQEEQARNAAQLAQQMALTQSLAEFLRQQGYTPPSPPPGTPPL